MTTDPNTPPAPTENKSAEYNFQQIRKQLENERYAREQAEIRAKQYEKEIDEYKSSQTKSKSEEDESYDDPYIDRKTLDKRFKTLESDIDKRIDQKAEEKARLMLEQDRQATFLRDNKDFEKVMSAEMLQKFVDTYPDVAEGILQNMPDDFNRQKHVYKTIKSLKLHLKPEETESIEKTIQKNQKSGLYQPSNVAPSPFKSTGDFSKQGQKQAYEQMEELASRFGGGGVKIG